MPVATYFSQEHIRKEQNRTIRQGLPRESLTRMILADVQASIQWDDEEEFSLNGQKYDVVDYKTEHGQRIMYCLADTKETELLVHAAKARAGQSSLPGKHVPAFKSFECTTLYKNSIENFFTLLQTEYPGCMSIALPRTSFDPSGPPPRIA